MAGFTDMVPPSSPAYYGGGVSDSLSAGRSYRKTWIDVVDSAGDPINLTAVTGTCVVVASDRTTVILTMTFTGGLGQFTISADESATAGLFTGADFSRGLVHYWSLVLTDGTDSVQMWMADNSTFTIRKGA